MHNSPSDYVRKLYEIVSAVDDLPQDDNDHHEHLKPLRHYLKGPSKRSFETLVNDSFLEPSKGKRKQEDVEKLRKHWELILLNLCFVMYQRQWLLVPGDSRYYSDYWAQRLGITYRPTKTVIDWLQQNDLVELLPGKRYKKEPKTNRIFPKPKLMETLWEFFLQIEQPIQPPYLEINDPKYKWGPVIHGLSKDHPDKADMATLNDFLKPHSWACKGPVKLIYKNSPFQGGRLYTPFQNLPDRRIRLRINTLIDGEPICEVDFSANHLRMNLANNGGVDGGDDPYTEIGDLAQIPDRSMVKKFITVAMGSSNEVKAHQACYIEGLSKVQVSALKDATQKIFPSLELFTGWCLYAQSIEGQILKRVMLSGVKEGIVCLPVHDAIAVPLKHSEWAREEMKYQWDKEFEVSGLARVAIDRPE